MIQVIGLGPGSLDRVPAPVLEILRDEATPLILRTIRHPAAEEIAAMRPVETCDDLYEEHESFPDVYEAIARRVLERASQGDVIYAVPGSPMIGELAVRQILAAADEVRLVPGISFVDAILAEVGYDPLDRGLQILDGHELPDPLVIDKPTIVAHLDRPEILADALVSLGNVIEAGSEVTAVKDAGSDGVIVVTAAPEDIDSELAGLRTSLFVDASPGGLVGAVRTMRKLRAECPWDQEQDHQSLVKNLIEETHELVEAIAALDRDDDPDWVGLSRVEDELGDVLMQVLFHEAIAREIGAFDIDGVSEVMAQKLIRRHPHVFGDVVVSGATEVKENWDRIKAGESPSPPASALDGVPSGLPGLQRAWKVQARAAKVGFDWERAGQVVPKVSEELAELRQVVEQGGDVTGELGDLLFSVVNLARHLRVDPEVALARAIDKFESRFRAMEAEGPLDDLTLDQMEQRWEQAKRSGTPPSRW